jgi:hypothetical protein
VAPAPGFRIVISTPTNQARVDQETVTFAGLVHGGTGVRQVLVTANGVELWRQDNRSQQPAMAVNLPVKLVEGQNTLVVTAAEIDGTMHQEMRTVYLEKPVPLAVDVRYPEDRSRVTDEASVVAAVARSSKGISRIIVALNGAEVHRQDERSPQKSMAVSAPLTLRDGPNAIVITALEPDGVARQEIRTVILERPKAAGPVAAPAPPPPPPSTQWAVIIGVGGYESTAVPKLRYPVADADAVYQTLIASGGFKKENILLLTDRTERKPTLRNIKWALGTFLARSAHKDDLVVIYFAGHGASEIDQRGVERTASPSTWCRATRIPTTFTRPPCRWTRCRTCWPASRPSGSPSSSTPATAAPRAGAPSRRPRPAPSTWTTSSWSASPGRRAARS